MGSRTMVGTGANTRGAVREGARWTSLTTPWLGLVTTRLRHGWSSKEAIRVTVRLICTIAQQSGYFQFHDDKDEFSGSMGVSPWCKTLLQVLSLQSRDSLIISDYEGSNVMVHSKLLVHLFNFQRRLIRRPHSVHRYASIVPLHCKTVRWNPTHVKPCPPQWWRWPSWQV